MKSLNEAVVGDLLINVEYDECYGVYLDVKTHRFYDMSDDTDRVDIHYSQRFCGEYGALKHEAKCNMARVWSVMMTEEDEYMILEPGDICGLFWSHDRCDVFKRFSQFLDSNGRVRHELITKEIARTKHVIDNHQAQALSCCLTNSREHGDDTIRDRCIDFICKLPDHYYDMWKEWHSVLYGIPEHEIQDIEMLRAFY